MNGVVVPPGWTLLEVEQDGLCVGDVVVDFTLGGRAWQGPRRRWTVGRIRVGIDDGLTRWYTTDGTLLWRSDNGDVLRLRVLREVSSGPDASAAADRSRWNGSCARCGRGTYTGAWDVEHEGGPCV